MRSHARRASRGKGGIIGASIDRIRRGADVLRVIGWRPSDVVGAVAIATATAAILVNGLFMQAGSHPAPLFKSAPDARNPVPVTHSVPPAVPRPRPPEPASAPKAAPPAARSPGEVINGIQLELARRGYYDGPVDGLYGPRTDVAIREFERGAGLKPSAGANEALLQAITQSSHRAPKGTAPGTNGPSRNEAAVERPAPSRRVIALQRALAEYGYGQIKATGIVDPDTQSAIEKFERERKLPITGQASERVFRELAAITGRRLE